MSYAPDPRIDDANSKSIDDIISRLKIQGLWRNGSELSGPCPLCGSSGHNPKSGPVDRFNINTHTGAFLCRKCDLRGGDNIALVRGVLGIGFKDALQWICGDAPAEIDPKEMAKREAEAEAKARAREKDAARFRQRSINYAQRIWKQSNSGHHGLVPDYLAARGLDVDRILAVCGDIPHALRYLNDHPYSKKIGGQSVQPHSGPCMIACIRGRDGIVKAVHQTWIDPKAPHGKAVIRHDGEVLPSKLVRGSKKGGVIRLHTPEGATSMVVGEGIETTLTALMVDAVPGAAYWCGVDLGNMAGRMERVPGVKHSGRPDMTDQEAFVPPPWVETLYFIQDGDSDPETTRAKLLCGLRRAMALRPGLVGKIVSARAGQDLNDMINSQPEGEANG